MGNKSGFLSLKYIQHIKRFFFEFYGLKMKEVQDTDCH